MNRTLFTGCFGVLLSLGCNVCCFCKTSLGNNLTYVNECMKKDNHVVFFFFFFFFLILLYCNSYLLIFDIYTCHCCFILNSSYCRGKYGCKPTHRGSNGELLLYHEPLHNYYSEIVK